MTDERGWRASATRELMRAAGLDSDAHPSAERLFEYQEGLLAPDIEDEVRDHLSLCPSCTRMVLELSGIVPPELPESGEPLSEERMAELWPGMRQRLAFASRPKPAPWRHSLDRIVLPLAAVLLLVTLVASLLLKENRRLTAPRGNVAILDLVPSGEEGVRRDGGRERSALREAEAVLLVLNLADLRPFPIYRAEILDLEGGEPLWVSDDLKRSVRGNFTLQLARPFPGSGRYRIRLLGIDGHRREPLAEYEIHLVEAD